MNIRVLKIGKTMRTEINWDNLTAFINTYADYPSPLEFTWYGEQSFVTKTITDTFNAFKRSIEDFIYSLRHKVETIERKQTLEIVEIIERGING